MVKQKKDIHITEQGIEEDDLLDLFVDNTASQFEDQLIKSKKKLLSAQKGRNEIFEFLKLKLKGLDMLITVMQNNKDMMRKDDLFCIEPLEKLLSYSKNDKVLFQPIVKK